MREILEKALSDVAYKWNSIPWEWRIEEISNDEAKQYTVRVYVNPNKAGEHMLIAAGGNTLSYAYEILITWMVSEGIQIKYEDRVAPRIQGLIQDNPPKNWPHNWLHAQQLNREAHERL